MGRPKYSFPLRSSFRTILGVIFVPLCTTHGGLATCNKTFITCRFDAHWRVWWRSARAREKGEQSATFPLTLLLSHWCHLRQVCTTPGVLRRATKSKFSDIHNSIGFHRISAMEMCSVVMPDDRVPCLMMHVWCNSVMIALSPPPCYPPSPFLDI